MSTKQLDSCWGWLALAVVLDVSGVSAPAAGPTPHWRKRGALAAGRGFVKTKLEVGAKKVKAKAKWGELSWGCKIPREEWDVCVGWVMWTKAQTKETVHGKEV